jgi:hypothetical protein
MVSLMSSSAVSRMTLRDQEIPEGADLHEIEIDNTGLGKGRYVVVRIRLFADRKLPEYYVVAGEST